VLGWLLALFCLPASCLATSDASQALSLRIVVERALADHPQMDAAKARLEIAKAHVRQAQAAFWPSVVAAAEYDEKELPLSALGMGEALQGPFAPSTIRSVIYREGIGIRMPIYRGGRDGQTLSVARLGKRESDFEFAAVREGLIANAIEAYVNHERTRELLKSAEEHESAMNGQLQRVERNIEAGMGVKFDRLQVEVRLESAREAVLAGQNAVDSARTALNLAMGESPSTPVSTLPVASFPAITQELSELQGEMIRKNPSLKQARKKVEASRRTVSMEHGGNRPSATLSGSLSNFGKDLPVHERGWTVNGSVEWKLFDGGFVRAKVDEARHHSALAQASLDDLQQQLLAALERSFLENRNALKRLEVSRKGLELAREQIRLSDVQRESGYITLIDLLDKQAELTRARVSLIGARYDTYLSALAILRLTGKLTPDFVAAL